MATNVRDTMKGLSPARRKKIEARAAALIAEFPDREPVTLSGLSTMETAPHPPTRRRRKRAREHAAQS